LLKISIEDLRFDCIIGILDFEREQPQEVIINLSFEYFFAQDGSNFIDYSEVVSYVENSMKTNKFKLIEDAILSIRKYLKSKYNIKNLKIKISKPNILPNCIVSVEE